MKNYKKTLGSLINIGFMLSLGMLAVLGAVFYKRLLSFSDGDKSAPVMAALDAYSTATMISLACALIFGGIIIIRYALNQFHKNK